MTTTYIRWPLVDDAAFRAAYLSTTGEHIQVSPDTDGATYLVGSSRIAQDQVAVLQNSFPDISFSPSWPDDFTAQ